MNMVPRHPFNEMKPNSGGNPDGTLFAHSKKTFMEAFGSEGKTSDSINYARNPCERCLILI
jgi:hypothetical protein